LYPAVESLCARFYAPQFERPSLTPGIYFRSLLIGYFEGIGAVRGIAWRLADSLALRRFVGIALDEYGSLKDTQSMLRHASIKTTGDIYVQTIDQNVLQAVNSRTAAVLKGWKAPVQSMGVEGRNVKGISAIRRSSAKPGKDVLVSC